MNDFTELKITLEPFEPWADVISQELSSIDFESFDQVENILKAYIRKDKFDESALKRKFDSFSDLVQIEYTIQNIPAKNWNEEWESNFDPIVIADKIYIHAPFHPSAPKGIQYKILLTPKMSFGTGHHATTSMMMRGMLDLHYSNASVLDVGCGTAILSVLAEMLGGKYILAIDNDDWAVKNSLENIVINNCTKISVENAEISSVNGKFFNIILANINRNVILRDIKKYAELMHSKGHLLLSGFREEDVSQLSDLALSLGFRQIKMFRESEWCMLHFVKDSSLE